MTCPFAHPTRGNGRCGGRGVLEVKSQFVPCPSCWAAAGRKALGAGQTRLLRLYHVLLIEVAGLGTDEPDRLVASSRRLDQVHGELQQAGVPADVRRAWVDWVEGHAGGDAMAALRDAVLNPPSSAA